MSQHGYRVELDKGRDIVLFRNLEVVGKTKLVWTSSAVPRVLVFIESE
jgi:hypothetical protein